MEEIRAILKELAVDLNTLKENQLEDRIAIQKLRKSQDETERRIAELQTNPHQRHIDYTDIDYGGFGSFIDGISTDLVKDFLYKQFPITHTAVYARSKKEGQTLEIEVLGYHYDQTKPSIAVACRIKSHVREYDVNELLGILRDFSRFFPAYKDKKLYGLLIGVQVDESIQHLAAKKGLLIAQVADDNFKLLVPESFQPKNFQVGL